MPWRQTGPDSSPCHRCAGLHKVASSWNKDEIIAAFGFWQGFLELAECPCAGRSGLSRHCRMTVFNGPITGSNLQPGSPSILSMEARSLSQSARLEKQICALGRMSIRLSSDPAGTTSKPRST